MKKIIAVLLGLVFVNTVSAQYVYKLNGLGSGEGMTPQEACASMSDGQGDQVCNKYIPQSNSYGECDTGDYRPAYDDCLYNGWYLSKLIYRYDCADPNTSSNYCQKRPECPNPTSGNPISTLTGHKYQTFIDYQHQTANLSVSRQYAWRSTAGQWLFDYQQQLVINEFAVISTTEIGLDHLEYGRVSFTGEHNSSGGTWTPVASVKAELVSNDDGAGGVLDYDVFFQSGRVDTFDSSGRLKSVVNSDGRRKDFTYDTTTINSVVYDRMVVASDTGDQLEFIYDEDGRVWKIIDPASNEIEYSWNADNMIISVEYQDGKTVTYDYELSSYPQALTKLTDEENRVYATWGYTAFRASSSEHGDNGAEKVTLDFTYIYDHPDWRVIETNAKGRDTIFHYEIDNGSSRIVEVEGTVSGSCVASNSHYTYDANGFVDTVQQENTFVTKTHRSAKGLIEVRSTGLQWSGTVGTSTLQMTGNSQMVKRTWHDDLSVIVKEQFYGRDVSVSAWSTYDKDDAGWQLYKTIDYTYDDGNGSGGAVNCDGDAAVNSYLLCSRKITDELDIGTPKDSRSWAHSYTKHTGKAILATETIDGPLAGSDDKMVYTYNASGQLTSEKQYTGATTFLEKTYSNYNAFGQPQTIVDENGIQVSLVYDVRGRLTSSTADSAGIQAQTVYEYYDNGLLKKMTHPDNSWVEYDYNDARQIIGMANNHGDYIAMTPSVLDGQWAEMEVCAAGTNGACTGTITEKYKRVFDDLGRLSKVQQLSDPSDETSAFVDSIIYGYDAAGNLSSKVVKGDNSGSDHDDSDIVKLNSYDSFNRMIATLGEFSCSGVCSLDSYNNYNGSVITSPLTSFSYNQQGLVASVVDANGTETTYSYNGYEEMIEQVSKDSGTTTYVYDSAGRVTQKTLADGGAEQVTTVYSYDSADRLTEIDYGNNGADITLSYDLDDSQHGYDKGRLSRISDESGITDYKYDALGRVIEKKFDPIGPQGALTTGYGYNKAGARTSLTYATGYTVNYTRSNDRLTKVDLLGVYDVATTINYRTFGGVSSFSQPMHVNSTDILEISRSYDKQGRLSNTNMDLKNDGGFDMAYGYDAYGNITTITDSLAGAEADQTFTYDGFQRLIGSIGLYGQYNYTYDYIGNRLSRELKRFDPADTTQTYTEVYTETYYYDDGLGGDSNNPASFDSNRLKRVLREDKNDADISQRSFTYDSRGNVVEDKREVYGGTTITTTLTPQYDDNNRMTDTAACDDDSGTALPACQ